MPLRPVLEHGADVERAALEAMQRSSLYTNMVVPVDCEGMRGLLVGLISVLLVRARAGCPLDCMLCP